MKSPEPAIPRIVGFFFLADLALVLLHLADWGLGHPSGKLKRMVDLGGEGNLPTWYSSMQLFLVALLLAVFVSKRFARTEPATWLLPVLPLVFALLSLDEVAQIHEWLGRRSDRVLLPAGREESFLPETGTWIFVIGVPFFILMSVIFFRLRRYLGCGRRVVPRFVLALCLYVGSAAGIEMLSNFFRSDPGFQLLQVCLEELGEMVAVTIFLWASLDLLCGHGHRLDSPEPL